KTLELYSTSKLDKFLIDFEYKTSYASEVNKWVCFATIHKVRKLYLEFETSGSSYLFPRLQWIGYARLSHDMMQNILLGSPALTELSLLQSDHTFTGLKNLELVGEKVLANSDDDSAIVEISAPNLQSLNISGFMNKKRFQLTQLLNMEETAVT
ncbi:hypothetical protein CFP56_022495, partial [Quercus suber]